MWNIARALAQRPDIILADEPIASLDPRSAGADYGCLMEINRSDKITILVSLHAVDFAKRYGKKIVGINDGKIVLEKRVMT